MAKKAGVSIGTASDALNGSHRVKKETREKVRAVARELKYRPNAMARRLLSQKTHTIGFVVNIVQSIKRYIAGNAMLIGTISNAEKLKYDVLTTCASEKRSIIDYGFELYYEKKVDGVLYYGVQANDPKIELLYDCEMPYVLLSAGIDDDKLNSVGIDNRESAKSLLEYMIMKGHKRIAHISGSQTSFSGIARKLGYQEALIKNGLEYAENLVVNTDYSVEGGYIGMKKLIGRKADFTAVFCGSDSIAMGAIKALNEIGLSVPKNIAVAGFGNEPATASFSPAITTVHVDYMLMGEIATHILVDLINKKVSPVQKITLPSELLIKDSC